MGRSWNMKATYGFSSVRERGQDSRGTGTEALKEEG